jgi:hypothetical protein
MPQARLGFFAGSQLFDFSAVHPDVVGILLEFRTAAGEPIGITINDTDADQLSLQLDALLDELANRRAGLPITPELWELDPAIDPDSPFELLKGDPNAQEPEAALSPAADPASGS